MTYPQWRQEERERLLRERDRLLARRAELVEQLTPAFLGFTIAVLCVVLYVVARAP
jgi:hypothetical protein